MKKRQFVHSFVLLLVLFAAIGIIFLSSNLKFTGMVVEFNEYENKTSCEGAGYNWEDITEENCTTTPICTNNPIDCEPCLEYEDLNGTQGDCILWTSCLNETCTDEETCEDIIIGGQCTGEVCDSNNLDLCLDETTCTNSTGYWYDSDSDGTSTCNDEEQCVPATCESLDYECGSIGDGCESTLDCGSCDSGYTCETGVCEAEETSSSTSSSGGEENDNAEIPSTTIISSNTVRTPSCVPDWQCGDWQECIDGNQVRACTDANTCNSAEGLPETSQSCVVEIKETCFDEIKNQDETGIDCGGSCEKKCSFFTIVGSAVSGPIDAGKTFVLQGMFGNVTKTIISISSLVFIAGGAFAGWFFLIRKKKGIKKLDKIIDNLDK
ncbi:hypothetical protein M0R19_00670 [Candidatus Pacearchaeota archaeon]|jgi:hypothetical protein|nr:hypothetical protein [Candidatus Pacearchaeota archaeon]